jgi:hypothetical protein
MLHDVVDHLLAGDEEEAAAGKLAAAARQQPGRQAEPSQKQQQLQKQAPAAAAAAGGEQAGAAPRQGFARGSTASTVFVRGLALDTSQQELQVRHRTGLAWPGLAAATAGMLTWPGLM